MPKLQKIGGSMFLSVPAEIVKLLDLKEGMMFKADYKITTSGVLELTYRYETYGSVWRMVPVE